MLKTFQKYKILNVYLIMFVIVLFQVFLLSKKYFKTVSEREDKSTCVVDCAEINTEYRNLEETRSAKLFKNSNLSALIFISKSTKNFELIGDKTFSAWNDEKFGRFLNLWAGAKFTISDSSDFSDKRTCQSRFDFPLFDLNPGYLDGQYLNITSVYLNSEKSTNIFGVAPDLENNTLVIRELIDKDYSC
jgi:hypothetical protein